ncbi:MAG: cytochrome c oxidase subunit II [Chloroflexi bacterium]|nr:cytochrome c oxidase subunit II [Chloroflexota bacterium]
MSTFDPHGPVAQRQMDLFLVIFWASVLIFVAVGGGLVYIMIRFRRRPGQDMPAQVHGNTRLEIGWTIAPAIVLAVIAVPTIIAQFYVSNAPEDAMEINVTAHQWWWAIEYLYSGLDTANEIHVPVGKAVKVNLTSTDVLHSFWVPKLAGKMDIFPGKTTDMWFSADDADMYFGQCAEFCGLRHSFMKITVFAEEEAEFEAMVREAEVVGMGYFQRVMLSRAGWKDGGVEGVSIRR